MNREHTMPHTVVLPIELYPPLYYSGMIRTFNIKHQKFRTYLLVYGILKSVNFYKNNNKYIKLKVKIEFSLIIYLIK